MNTDSPSEPAPVIWAVIELMGHNKTGGRVSKDSQLGTAMLRLDIPQEDGTEVTQLVNPSSCYRITFCEEAVARAAARHGNHAPYSMWELKQMGVPVTTPALPAPSDLFDEADETDDDDTRADRY